MVNSLTPSAGMLGVNCFSVLTMEVYEITTTITATFNVASTSYEQAVEAVKSEVFVECQSAIDGIGQYTPFVHVAATGKRWDEETFTEIDLDEVPF